MRRHPPSPSPGLAPVGRGRRRSRGQSLVEFALVLPILLVLLMISFDFGRIFLGYVNLQNMARIGASYAAANPAGWEGAGDATVQDRYQSQITNDAKATNCQLPKIAGTPTAPQPTFSGTNLGDTATVQLTCSFQVLTPIISSIVGGSVSVSASAAFPVRSAIVATGGGGGVNIPTAILTASPTSGSPGLEVTFDGSLSQGSIATWHWDFGNGMTSDLAAPTMPIVYNAAGSYTATLTVSNAAGSDTDQVVIAVAVPPLAIDFESVPSPAAGTRPLSVTFHDLSTGLPANPTWSWTFGDGGTSTDQNPTHVYLVAGTYNVSLSISGSAATVKAAMVVVSDPLCTVPDFTNKSTNVAQSLWNAAGFNTTVQYKQGGLPWTIKSQTIVGNSQVVCTATIQVSKN